MTPPVLEPRSSGQLLRATATAALVAAILLTTVVLPAEHAFDPTGAGRALGILRPAEAGGPPPLAGEAVAPPAAPAEALARSATPYRSDEMSVVLEPGEGAEVKASMAAGQVLVFSWEAEAPVEVDMHGEPAGSGAARSYWREGRQSSGHGTFEAPFSGSHGWFWQNLAAAPVKVRVRTSGFYEKLYRP